MGDPYEGMPPELRKMLAGLGAIPIGGCGHSHATSHDPEKYPRRVEIRDSDALMMITESEELHRKARRAAEEARAADQEYRAFHDRLFLRLDELYPSIREDGGDEHGGMVGYRTFRQEGEERVRQYYVGWSE